MQFGGGEPVIALISWILWLATGLVIDDVKLYFGLTGFNFLLGILWMMIAKRNIPSQPADEIKIYVDLIRSAHSRWWKFNLIPGIIGVVYFIIFSFGIIPDWTYPIFWIGPVIMFISFICDFILGYNFMFTKVE
ncbi:MAG: hypothetical protein QW735_03215 [archaeon]